VRTKASQGTYHEIVDAVKDNKVWRRKLLQMIHVKCKAMHAMRSKREQQPGRYMAMVNVAAKDGKPRQTLLVCALHRQEMSAPYVADKPDAQAHRFCHRLPGSSFPKGCRGIGESQPPHHNTPATPH
jgi:hypothetical protein